MVQPTKRWKIGDCLVFVFMLCYLGYCIFLYVDRQHHMLSLPMEKLLVPVTDDEFYTLQVARKTLEKVNATACIFSIQLIQDWLCLEESFRPDPAHDRINMPGLSPGENWRYRIPFPLEKLKKLKVCRTIRRLNQKTQRLA